MTMTTSRKTLSQPRVRAIAPIARWAGGALLVLVMSALLWVPEAAAASQGALRVDVAVNGQPALTSSDARPAQLYPNRPAEVHLTVTNGGSTTVDVATVRFQGQVLDLPLFSFNSDVNLVVAPGSSGSLTFPVSMTGVGGQATGLVVSNVTLLSTSGGTIATQAIVTNVHGSLKSIYGLFGLAVLVLTVSSLLFALIALARHTLPQNRWMRAIRFLIPGFGIGLVLTFTLSAFGIFTPGPGHWLSLMVVTTVGGFAVGYLTPAPNEEEFDDYDENVLLAQIVVVDEDPLEADGQGPAGERERELVGAVMASPSTSGSASGSASRATAAPESGPTSAPDTGATAAPAVPESRPTVAPESRPTSAPDSRATTAPGLPDSRPTSTGPAAPESRPTVGPETKPAAAPDSRPTTAPS